MSTAKSQRTRQLARIHCLKRDIGMTDEQYEAVLWTVARVESSKDLDAHGRMQVIRQLETRLQATRKGQRYPGRPHNADRPQIRKIEALLADAGRPWAYADTIAKRITGKDRITFCSDADLGKIIAALEYDAGRRKRREEQAR